ATFADGRPPGGEGPWPLCDAVQWRHVCPPTRRYFSRSTLASWPIHGSGLCTTPVACRKTWPAARCHPEMRRRRAAASPCLVMRRQLTHLSPSDGSRVNGGQPGTCSRKRRTMALSFPCLLHDHCPFHIECT